MLNPVFITIEGLPRNFPLSECLSSNFLSVSLCPAASLPSSVSLLFFRCNRPSVFQLPVVVGVSAVQSRVEQKVTRVQLSFLQQGQRWGCRWEHVWLYQKSEMNRAGPFTSILQDKLSAVWERWDFRTPTAGCMRQELAHSHWSNFLLNISLSEASLMRHRKPSEKSNLHDLGQRDFDDTDGLLTNKLPWLFQSFVCMI